LLSNLSKLVLVVSILIFISGCTKRSYNSSYYSSKAYKKSNQYKKIRNQEIRDSKAMHRATMRPYVVFGKKYYPTMTKVGASYNGIASWYGPDFHAKKTSNGEIYDMHANTAASKTLPMNTMVKVYNKDNGKSTIVRINDRGPFVAGRIIDLSNKAARKIDMVKKGTANVTVTVLGFHGKIARTRAEKNEQMSAGKYYVQVGAFSKIEGAKITKKKFNSTILDGEYKAIIKQTYLNDKKLNRVWISGFRSEEEANDFKKQNGLDGAMIIAK
jgi:rare lipoprotein A